MITASAGVAQLVRAPPCHGGGRGFESRLSRHSFNGLAQVPDFRSVTSDATVTRSALFCTASSSFLAPMTRARSKRRTLVALTGLQAFAHAQLPVAVDRVGNLVGLILDRGAVGIA